GLPQSGKTTLFNALTRAGAPAGGAAGKARVAAAPRPGPRGDGPAEAGRRGPREGVNVAGRFVDVAGLAAGGSGGLAAQGSGGPGGSGLAPRYLGALREGDALAIALAGRDGAWRQRA